jgi:hypothetical protein
MQFPLHLSSFARARHRRELARRRRRADDELRRGSHAARLAWRFDELTRPEHRRELAAELRAVADDLADQGRFALSARPLNRTAARPHRFLLRRLATRLQDVERPLDAASLLAVEDLLCDGGSPLYSPAYADQLEPTLRDLLARIEARA